MSPSTEIELVKAFYRAIEAGDPSPLDNLLAADYRLHFPGVPVPLDRDAAKGFYAGFGAALANLHHTIEDAVVGTEAISVRLTIRGLHRGNLNGIPATGNEVAVTALNLFHLADGKLAEQWVEYDGVGLLQQVGALPRAAA